MAVRILTDSAADMAPDQLEQLQVECVPMTILFDEEEYLDGETLSKADFFRKLTQSGHLPKTAQPSPEKFLERFQEAKKAGDEVVVITISSLLSGAFQSANLGKEMAEYESVYLVDSLQAAAGQMLLVKEAAALRDAGKTGGQIAEALGALKGRIRLRAAMDTIEYLQKGGRLSRMEARLGALASIKPLVAMEKGRVILTDKCLGRKRALRKMADYFKNASIDTKYPIFYIYSMDPSNCRAMLDLLKRDGGSVCQGTLQEIGGTVGAHIGPDAFGFVFVEK